MIVVEKAPSIPKTARRQRKLYRLAGLVLVAGYAGAVILAMAPQLRHVPKANVSAEGGWQDTTLPPADTKIFSRDVEMNYGKIGVLVARGQVWWEDLDPAERWAILLAVLSSLVAAGCYLAGRYVEA